MQVQTALESDKGHASRGYWAGKRVFITGASSGIGRALALHLTRRRAAVGLIARRRELLQQLVGEIRSAGGSAEYATADVTDFTQMQAAATALLASLGPCDVVIANAGINHNTPARNFPAEHAAQVIETNVIGVINTIGAFLPAMIERNQGHLVAVAGLAAAIGLPEAGAYCASKSAVVTLMESMAVDLKRHDIKVSTICPGFTNTPLVANYKRGDLLFLMSADEAARRTARAIERGRRHCSFPWRTWALLRMARLMPFSLYRRIIAKQATPDRRKMPKK